MKIAVYFDVPIELLFSFRPFNPSPTHCAAPPRLCPDLDRMLMRIQNDLFDLGADLATPETRREAACEPGCASSSLQVEPAGGPRSTRSTPISRRCVLRAAGRLTGRRPHSMSPALWHAGPSGAWSNWPRWAGETVVEGGGRPTSTRLSDFLFVAARWANDKGGSDVLWVPGQEQVIGRAHPRDGSELMFIPLHDANSLKYIKVQYVTIGLILRECRPSGSSPGCCQPDLFGRNRRRPRLHPRRRLRLCRTSSRAWCSFRRTATYITYAFLHTDFLHLGDEHAVPLGVRRQCRGCAGAFPVPRLLSRSAPPPAPLLHGFVAAGIRGAADRRVRGDLRAWSPPISCCIRRCASGCSCSSAFRCRCRAVIPLVLLDRASSSTCWPRSDRAASPGAPMSAASSPARVLVRCSAPARRAAVRPHRRDTEGGAT